MLAKPLPFSVGHRGPKRVLPLQARAFQRLLRPREWSDGLSTTVLFRQLPGQCHQEAKAVLEILDLGLAHDPVPIQVGVCHRDPDQGLHQARIEICRLEGAMQHLRRVEALPRLAVRESGITERGQGGSRRIVGQRGGRGTHGQCGCGKAEQAGDLARQGCGYGSLRPLEEADVSLRNAQALGQILLGPAAVPAASPYVLPGHARDITRSVILWPTWDQSAGHGQVRPKRH